MLKCPYCKTLVNEDDIVEKHNCYGEDISCNYVWEKDYSCPKCHTELEEVFECESCGNYFTESELTNGYCPKCLEESICLENITEYVKDMGYQSEFNDTLKEFVMDNVQDFIDWLKRG